MRLGGGQLLEGNELVAALFEALDDLSDESSETFKCILFFGLILKVLFQIGSEPGRIPVSPGQVAQKREILLFDRAKAKFQ